MAGRGLNKVFISGNLGKDPDMRYTPAGKAICNFNVAVGGGHKGADGTWQENTEWFRVVTWDKLAETCNQLLHKGSKVLVEGRLQTRKWTDQAGAEQRMVEVVAAEVLFLDAAPGRSGAAPDPALDDSEIPF